jgi:hypothetical protein
MAFHVVPESFGTTCAANHIVFGIYFIINTSGAIIRAGKTLIDGFIVISTIRTCVS